MFNIFEFFKKSLMSHPLAQNKHHASLVTIKLLLLVMCDAVSIQLASTMTKIEQNK